MSTRRTGWSHALLGPTLRDDRGRAVRSSPAFERPESAQLPSLQQAEHEAYRRWERTSARLARPGSKVRLLLITAIGLWFVGIIIAAVWLAITNAPGWAGWALAVAGATAIAAPLFVWERRQMALSLRRSYLVRRLCPSCSYALSGIPADPDACTTCPECSAAWRLPPDNADAEHEARGTRH